VATHNHIKDDSTDSEAGDLDGVIRFKFTSEFKDRTPFAIDLCTDMKSIMQFFVYMISMKERYPGELGGLISYMFTVMTSILQAIDKKAKGFPSGTGTASTFGQIFGPFTPTRVPPPTKEVKESDKDEDKTDETKQPTNIGGIGFGFPPGIAFPSDSSFNLKDIGDLVDKMNELMNNMNQGAKDKGYASYSPADLFKKMNIDPKKIFDQDNATGEDITKDKPIDKKDTEDTSS
jgi:hypothetical protein